MNKNKYTVEEVMSGLNKAIRDKSNRYYHQYRNYGIELVVETDEPDVFRVGYRNFENFDIIDLKIDKDIDFESLLAIMNRENLSKYGGSCPASKIYLETMTFKERLVEKMREAIKLDIIYGDLWIISMNHLDNAKSYINVLPCVEPGIYNTGTILTLYTDVLKVVRMNKEEEKEYMDMVIKNVKEYAKDMSTKVKNDKENVLRLVGFEKVEKVEI